MKGFFKNFNAKTATVLGVAVIAVLVVGVGVVYGLGLHKGAEPEMTADTVSSAATTETAQETTETVKPTDNTKQTTKKKETTSAKETTAVKQETKKVAANKPAAASKATAASKEEKGLYCKLTITCKTAVGNSDLKDSKKNVVPASGVLYATKKVKFEKNDSVYDVLRRETKASGIHMESVKSPVYNSQYIKGIGNLYEFDCGELSGWMYKVNDAFPHYGCSQYKVKNGDNIQWVYTCDLGEDIGGRNY